MIFEERVSKPILDKLPATIELTVFGLVICLGLGIPLGVRAARRRRTGHDFGIRLYANIVYCIPVFWMGLMLQMIFGVFLNLFPISGRIGSRVIVRDFDRTGFYVIDTLLPRQISLALGDVLYHLVLPAVTLGIILSGVFVRLTRANMLDVLKSRLRPREPGARRTRAQGRLQARAQERPHPHRHDAGAAVQRSPCRGHPHRDAPSPGRAWVGCFSNESTCETIRRSRESSSCMPLS